MKTLAIAVLALSAGCAGLSPQAQSIKQVDDTAVTSCSFLQRIDAGYVPHSAASSLEVASGKKDALEKAAGMGATHVVWNERQGNPDRTVVTAAAYRCPEAATPPASATPAR